MRKSLIDGNTSAVKDDGAKRSEWLVLDDLASVEITSEDSHFPIDHALRATPGTGWRAAAKGPQFVRITFDKPTAIRRVRLHFIDRQADRSQEFAIYAKTDGGEMREIVRQQFSFSPGGSTEEIEDYTVDLKAVTKLELRIDPDRAHDPTHSQHFAVLQSLRLA